MTDFDKVYKKTASQVIARCHGAIQITKHGKILKIYDSKRHIWSKGLAGLFIREECENMNLRAWEAANVRRYIIEMVLKNPSKQSF